MDLNLEQINEMICMIRGQRVMLDSDLAKLYEVDTKALNRQVKRNIIRFPNDFMFKLSIPEFDNLKRQNGASSLEYGGRRTQPFVFTESGVAMLSSVLKSDRAALVNISIMRIFIKLRSFFMFEKELTDKVGRLESGTNKIFKVVFERLDNLEEEQYPKYEHPKDRKKIGLKS